MYMCLKEPCTVSALFKNSVKREKIKLEDFSTECRKWHHLKPCLQHFPGEHAPGPPREWAGLWRPHLGCLGQPNRTYRLLLLKGWQCMTFYCYPGNYHMGETNLHTHTIVGLSMLQCAVSTHQYCSTDCCYKRL